MDGIKKRHAEVTKLLIVAEADIDAKAIIGREEYAPLSAAITVGIKMFLKKTQIVVATEWYYKYLLE